MRIRALVVERKDAPFDDQEIELGEPGRGEVLVRIVASGVCHTDAITRAGDMPMPFPAVLGHEGAGIVEKVGEGVSQVAVGDKRHHRLAVVRRMPQLPRRAAALLPAHWRGAGVRTSLQGRAAEGLRHTRVTVSRSTATSSASHPSPRTRSPRPMRSSRSPGRRHSTYSGHSPAGSRTGAGAVLNEARPRLGDSVLIVGVGAVGLAAIMAARNSGVTKIIAADVHDSRLEAGAGVRRDAHDQLSLDRSR